MKKKNLVISILLMCFMCAGTLKTAEAAEYIPEERIGAFTDYQQYYSYGSKLIGLADDYIAPYKDKPYNKVIIYTISSEDEDKKADRKEFVCENDKTYPLKFENNNVYTYVKHGNNKTVVQVRNQKGKIKKSYPIKINKKYPQKIKDTYIEDVTIKGRKMYYVLNVVTKKDKNYNYLQCYDLKKKKVISDKRLNASNGAHYQFDSGKLYYYNDFGSIIKEYDLNGKRMSLYKLPEGETAVTDDGVYDGYTYADIERLDFNGNCIYYCNRNGVYRCDTKGDGVFELIYNGSGDVNFTYVQMEGIRYFKVLDNGNFYISIGDFSDDDTSIRWDFMYKKQP